MSTRYKTLIHTALYPEAKPIIHYFNLVQNKTHDIYRIYENENYILVVSGMGSKNVNLVVPFIYDNFKINKAINIGIAGCKDKSIKLGSLFCTNQNLSAIKFQTLTSVDEPLDDETKLNTTLVDMEAQSFLKISKNNLNEKDIYVFKIVSDYLSKKIPDKSLVYNSIKKSIPKWENVI